MDDLQRIHVLWTFMKFVCVKRRFLAWIIQPNAAFFWTFFDFDETIQEFRFQIHITSFQHNFVNIINYMEPHGVSFTNMD